MESSKPSYQFGSYRLDTGEGVLLHEGQPVSLAPKAFTTLLVLVQNKGHVVGKDELMKQVWPDTCVEEANLTQNIFTLRRILGESGKGSKYIETIPRRGYRFIAAVEEVSESESALPTSPLRAPDGLASHLQPDRTARFLAILPFVNASGEATMDYLSDGITESIINSLAQLPLLRVMSRTTAFRYKGRELDAQQVGRELGVDAVLVGRVHSQEHRLLISAELVDVAHGWQLWGENYDRGSRAIFEVQDEIGRQISAALRLRLTGDEERRLTRRDTKSAEAYQSYLQGRYHWSKYTRGGLEQAIGHFHQAICLDSNYALAYAGIVDCYLRLATNYIPPSDALPKTIASMPAPDFDDTLHEAQGFKRMFKMRQEWDQKAAERESKRAIELKANYPAYHQWLAAYRFSAALYDKAATQMKAEELGPADDGRSLIFDTKLPGPVRSASPTQAEEVQVFCSIAREQMEVGNYEAGCAVLERWWTVGQWPRLEGLGPHSTADLLLTAGTLAGYLVSTRQVPRGQKHAEALLNGSLALFEQLDLRTRSAEARIELGWCYYREGLFDLAHTTLDAAFQDLPSEDRELKSLAIIRLAAVDRHAGRLHDSVTRLKEAAEIVELGGPWITGRYHSELATALKDLAIAETRSEFFDRAFGHYQEALYEFEAIGNHRLAAIVENNYGYLLLSLKRLNEAETRLARARRLFATFDDKVRRAQVDETLAQLHIAAGRLDLAEQAILRAVESLEKGGEEALLSEALTTQGVVLCRLGRHSEAKRVLERSNRVAESCDDSEGAGRALLIVIEEMCEELDDGERLELENRLDVLLGHSQQRLTLERLRKCHERIANASAGSDTRTNQR